MRWWHIPAVMVLEDELFGAEAWSAAAYWNELAEPATRHYVVAVAGDDVVGYAGLAVFGDEAHVLPSAVAGPPSAAGSAATLLRDLLAAAGAPPGAARRAGRQPGGAAALPAARLRAGRPPPALLPAERGGRGGDGPRS